MSRVVCDKCHGKGHVDVTCDDCNDTGRVHKQEVVSDGEWRGMAYLNKPCPRGCPEPTFATT